MRSQVHRSAVLAHHAHLNWHGKLSHVSEREAAIATKLEANWLGATALWHESRHGCTFVHAALVEIVLGETTIKRARRIEHMGRTRVEGSAFRSGC